MKIKLSEIKDPGNPEKERIVATVLSDTDLGGYILAETQETSDETISSELKNVKWLEDQPLKVGDMVIIYTKSGKNGKIINVDGSTSYFYYWALDNPIGNKENVGVILYEAEWSFIKAHPDKIKADEFDDSSSM